MDKKGYSHKNYLIDSSSDATAKAAWRAFWFAASFQGIGWLALSQMPAAVWQWLVIAPLMQLVSLGAWAVMIQIQVNHINRMANYEDESQLYVDLEKLWNERETPPTPPVVILEYWHSQEGTGKLVGKYETGQGEYKTLKWGEKTE